ncbi:MAG: TlpA disulfide reductase family protein [Chromatiales bacterium]|jgi:peroxiredoxin|nr:TlpA disulfide reductase family protein [Chromatiales bacterium]MDX9767182.1 TlpA disulfide reductase family protein [Ectothiorhodospiraceae bacterium]
MKRKDLVIAGIVALLIGAVLAVWLSPEGLKPAPQVSLRTLDGTALTLADLRGRPVLVTFWSTTCVSCVREMPHLVELHRKLSPQGLEIVGVAMAFDTPEAVAEMTQARGLPYTIVHDADASVAQAFGGVMLTPTTFLISPEGRIVMQKLGDLDMTLVEHNIRNMI